MSTQTYQMEKLSNLLQIDNKTVEPNPDEHYEYYTVPNYGEENFPYQEKGSNIQSSKNVVKKGHLLVCKINPRISRIYYLNKDSSNTQIASTEFMPFLINEQRLFPKYVEMFLKTPQVKSHFQSRATGTSNSHKRMKSKDVLDLQIPLPPINIQKEITEKLSTASSLIKEREKANHLTNKLLQAVFLKMFGDSTKSNSKIPIKRIKDLSKVITKGDSPLWRGDAYQRKGIPIIRIKNIKNYRIVLDDADYITEAVHKRMKRSQLQQNDVIISIAGTLGRTALVTSDVCPANMNQDQALIRLNQEIVNPEYVLHALSTDYVKHQIDSIKRGATRLHLNLQQVGNLEIPIPEKSLQNRFVTIAQELEELKAKQTQSTNEVNALFGSLMSKAFKGELVN